MIRWVKFWQGLPFGVWFDRVRSVQLRFVSARCGISICGKAGPWYGVLPLGMLRSVAVWTLLIQLGLVGCDLVSHVEVRSDKVWN